MKLQKPTFSQILCFLLFVAVLHNTYLHYSHPAYKYYRETSLNLHSQMDGFKKEVAEQFVPAVREVASNMVAIATVDHDSFPSPQLPDRDSEENSTSSIVEKSDGGSHGGFTFAVPCVEVASYVYCSARIGTYGEKGVYINDWFYRLGDSYFGSPIVSISPECTICRDFVLIPSKSNIVKKDSVL